MFIGRAFQDPVTNRKQTHMHKIDFIFSLWGKMIQVAGQWPKIDRSSNEATRRRKRWQSTSPSRQVSALCPSLAKSRPQKIMYLGGNHVHQQIHHAVAVAPLVVIPRPWTSHEPGHK